MNYKVMKNYLKTFMALAIVLVSGVSYAMIQNNETEVSANEGALGYSQPCLLDEYVTWVCDEEQNGPMCFCELDYTR